jgi:hypothetical protein
MRQRQKLETDIHLTTNDLAERWRLSTGQLRNLRVAGRGCQFIKLGRAVRYRLVDVVAFETAHIAGSTSVEVGR